MIGFAHWHVDFDRPNDVADSLPVMAAFLFALTAITYQFQGWLASMMSNPRKRRTVIVFGDARFFIAGRLQTPNWLTSSGRGTRSGSRSLVTPNGSQRFEQGVGGKEK